MKMESAWHGGVSRLFSVDIEAIFIAEDAIVVIHRKVENGGCPVHRFCVRGVASRNHNRSSHKTVTGNDEIKSTQHIPSLDVRAPASNCAGIGYLMDD
jgi:hypothetical protein